MKFAVPQQEHESSCSGATESRLARPGDLFHTFDVDPNVVSKDARRPRDRNCCLLGALGHGAGAFSLRAATYRTNSGGECTLTRRDQRPWMRFASGISPAPDLEKRTGAATARRRGSFLQRRYRMLRSISRSMLLAPSE